MPHRSRSFLPNDIAVISLAQPITTISPAPIAGLIPAAGTVLVSAGYGASGTGTNFNPINPLFDNTRRNMTIEFGAFAPPPALFGAGPQPFLQAQFRDPFSRLLQLLSSWTGYPHNFFPVFHPARLRESRLQPHRGLPQPNSRAHVKIGKCSSGAGYLSEPAKGC
jgi:hypothetical protein